MKEILLIGGGGHCSVVIETLRLLENFKIAGIIDIKEKIGQLVNNVPVIGCDTDIKKLTANNKMTCIITAGSITTPVLRKKLAIIIEDTNLKFESIIHPTAQISSNVKIGKGTFIASGVIINSGVKIGNHCIINTGAIIEHDCKIGNLCHISSGSIISGGVKIGNETHIGAGSTIIQYIDIGNNTIIGIGSVVTKSIKSNCTAYGVPCKIIKETEII